MLSSLDKLFTCHCILVSVRVLSRERIQVFKTGMKAYPNNQDTCVHTYVMSQHVFCEKICEKYLVHFSSQLSFKWTDSGDQTPLVAFPFFQAQQKGYTPNHS